MSSPAAPERNLTSSWYNVTVLVKMNFQELQQVDLRLLNHMRLLHSMVGGRRASLQASAGTGGARGELGLGEGFPESPQKA